MSASGGDDMAARVRAFDWSRTPLGPLDRWPQSLKTAVSICLGSRFPMMLWWGPDLINIYNDAFISVLGGWHPRALGMSGREVWTETWPVIGPQVAKVMEEGGSTLNERVRLVYTRHGYPEETWFTWSFGPIRDESGRVAGLFNTCHEDTQQVLAERERDRLAEQRQLAIDHRQLALDAAQLGWWHYDPATKVATYDRRYAEIFGVSGDERPNEELLRRLHPDDLRGVWAKVEAALNPTYPQPYSAEFRILLDDGSMHWIEAHGTPAFEGEGRDRRATSFVGTVADITDRKRAEEQVRRSHDTFYHLIQNNPFGVYVVDADFRLREVSLGSQKVFATVPRPLLGRDFAEVLRFVWAEPFASEAIARFRRTLETGEPYVATRSVERRQDVPEVEAYDWRIERVTLPDGRFGVVCYFYDLTERQRLEAALRQSEARRAAALAIANLGTFEWDVRTNAVTLDDRSREIFGFRPGEGTRAEEVFARIDPADLPRVSAEAQASQRDLTRLETEYRINLPDGTARTVVSINDVIVGPDGKVGRMFGVFGDITARKQTEEALRRGEAQFRHLADAMPQMVWVARPDGYHEYFNERWYEFTGVPEGSTDGEGWNGLFHPDDQSRAWERWRHSLATGEPYEVEYRLRHRSGEYRWTLGRALAIRDERGQITRWFGTCTDIDGMKRLMDEREHLLEREHAARTEAEAANRAKDKFLAVLSHELRTPLSPVVMTIPSMEIDPELPFKFREDLAMVRRNIDLEVKLIDDLLDLSRVTSGKLRLNMQPVRVHELLRHVVQSSEGEAAGKRLRVRQELLADNDEVSADAARLQQVFWNLVRNSIKFTPDGGDISVRTRNAGDGRLLVEVDDSGVGIPSESLPRIFDAFEQGETRMTRQFGGLGLGLAIAKAVVEMHGGTVQAASEGPGKGATFTVELTTVHSVTETEPMAVPAPAVAARHPQSRVLLVEDHPDTSRAIAVLLSRSGYVVRAAHSVASALQLAAAESFDIMVSDIGLPDATGYELMEQIRDRYGIKGIALSGYGMEEDVRKSREAGFVEHVIKPIDAAQLQGVIERVLGAHPPK